jgi:hypothetical protein
MCKTQEHVARIAVQQFPMGYPVQNSALRRICRRLADIVAKVENRTTPKTSQTLIFGRLRHCNTPQCQYEAP